MNRADSSDEPRLAELREWLQREESWASGRLQPSDLAFAIRLIDEARAEHARRKAPHRKTPKRAKLVGAAGV